MRSCYAGHGGATPPAYWAHCPPQCVETDTSLGTSTLPASPALPGHDWKKNPNQPGQREPAAKAERGVRVARRGGSAWWHSSASDPRSYPPALNGHAEESGEDREACGRGDEPSLWLCVLPCTRPVPSGPRAHPCARYSGGSLSGYPWTAETAAVPGRSEGPALEELDGRDGGSPRKIGRPGPGGAGRPRRRQSPEDRPAARRPARGGRAALTAPVRPPAPIMPTRLMLRPEGFQGCPGGHRVELIT